MHLPEAKELFLIICLRFKCQHEEDFVLDGMQDEQHKFRSLTTTFELQSL